MSQAIVRNNGQFVKGVSGNPAGRPKGTKNEISEIQQKLELAVRQHVSIERFKRLVNKTCELAENGNMAAMKLIWDKMIPNAAPPNDEAQDNGRTVVFRIENATFGALPAPPIESASTDVEYEEVK